MYTVVLMMAMTGSSEATTFGGRRCHGCNGGNGCHVVACNGCNGGCHARRTRGHGRCNGGCHGCHGSAAAGHGCHGGCHGGAVIVQPRRNGEFAEEQSETGPIPQNGQVRSGSAPATIIVNLPAEARLTVDGQPTTSTAGRRVFVSPPLATGSEYFYTINAEIMRNGQPVTVTRRVPVSAGRETQISLDFDHANGNLQQGQPARGAQEAQPAREPQNLERPKNNNNNNNQQNREPQPNR